MSLAHVDLVRSIFARWERGEFSSADWADPEIEFVFADGPAAGRFRGRAEMADAIRNWLDAWDDLQQLPEEVRELDEERVLVLHRFAARGKRSGLGLAQMRAEGAVVFEFREGWVTRLIHYFDRDRAFADLGISR
jgi:ketosteroid isomerase-like protein